MSTHSIITTPLVGGAEGIIFQDVLFQAPDGNLVMDPHNRTHLDVKHPIQRITVYHDEIVDGLEITYQHSDGGARTVEHGSQCANATDVDINADETIVGVFGRAGTQSFYKRELVNNIGFVIYDAVKGTTRISGPYGNSNKTDQGKCFYTSDVIAFGGFATHRNEPTALSGLFFYKDGGKV